MDALVAWLNGIPIGEFVRRDDGLITFAYLDSDPLVPISLSLLPGHPWPKAAPGRFLEGLLPDGPQRAAMARRLGTSPHDLFGLLRGADSEGGFVFLPADQDPSLTEAHANIATDAAIADKIDLLGHDESAWWSDTHADRFALNGNQPKFALEYVPPPKDQRKETWLWPNAAWPSTHIFKPPLVDPDRADAPVIEACSSELARLAGLPITDSGIMSFDGRTAFVIERFDRRYMNDGRILRLHAEDLLQALGQSHENKYSVTAKQVLNLLRAADPTLELSYQWVRQLAFNTSIDNVDAHAQNYSILITPQGLEMSPMYDLLTTTYWPWVDQHLAMKIGGMNVPAGIRVDNWRKLATSNSLDPDRVAEIAVSAAKQVVERAPEAYSGAPARIRDAVLRIIRHANRQMIRPS